MGRNEKIKILHLSAVDYGGAGKFAVEFNRFLKQVGYETTLLVKDKKDAESDTLHYPIHSLTKPWEKGLRKISKLRWSETFLDANYYFYNLHETYTVVSVKKILALIPYKPDIIFIHWVSDFINSKLINELKKLTAAKIYWLMIDNAPLTGGCHYPWSCTGYQNNCGDCPAILNPKFKERAKHNLSFKETYLPTDLGLITFSENDRQRALLSSIFRGKSIYKWIAYVDEKRFTVGDPISAKLHFGLPKDKRVIFFGATSLKEKRKGMALLLQAIDMITADDIIFLIAGHLDSPLPHKNIKLVGSLNEDNLIKAYQAADLFVCPSIEDSGPMMINQSLMCGTPVVAFSTGVAIDLVHTHKTGYRAPTINYQELSKGILSILQLTNLEYQCMAQNCRDMAVSLYSTKSFQKQISDLLEISIVEKNYLPAEQ